MTPIRMAIDQNSLWTKMMAAVRNAIFRKYVSTNYAKIILVSFFSPE
jgi:hypothetical protein